MAVELGLELTSRCNLACSHCLRDIVPPSSPRARDIPYELVVKMLDECGPAGIKHVGITGGEPMLHPDFLRIVDAIVERGLTYHFLSNAVELPAFMPRFLARPERRQALRSISVSIDGARPESHDRVRGKGMFKRSLAGLAVLRALKIPFSLLHVITRVSKDEIDHMGLLAHHVGAERLLFCHFMPNGRNKATEDLDLTTAERLHAEEVIKRLMHAMRFEIIMGEGYYAPEEDHVCATTDRRSLNVDPSGHLTFCCELSNFNGDDRTPADRPDWVADMREVTISQALELQGEAVRRFRESRLAYERSGGRTEDDKFACRYCVKHFGKPERPVQIRRRSAAGSSISS